MILRKSLLAGGALLLLPAAAGGEEAGVFTLWPFDYRHSSAADYASFGVGPFLKYERKGKERAFALRPLYYRAWDPEAAVGFSETLYPIASTKWSQEVDTFQGLRLLSSDFGEREMGSDNRFMLFPFLFYGKTETQEPYFAFFPFGGKILDQFWRDEIRFTLFPLYGQTRKGETVNTHLLWPVFSSTRGPDERGLRIWPLAGASEKKGVYRKRFFLWPVFFAEELKLDSDNPERRRAVFPLYVRHESPQATATTVLWPFFSHHRDLVRGREEWNFPWPLLRIADGADRRGFRLLPLYADEQTGAMRKRWVLWPLYKREEMQTGMIDRRRDRILFFLFSRLREEKKETGALLHRVALWPLFTYEAKNGIASFHTLSLLEPLYPDSDGLRRNWSPLWQVYQTRRDSHGNEISSLLWNLYWKERQGEDLAVELFPLWDYRRDRGDTDVRLLKGLLRYRTEAGRRQVNLFYLPWGLQWGAAPATQTEGETD